MSEEATTTQNTYLTFTLDEEQYAVDVRKVKEVLEYTRITRVPRTKEYMRGVINLRGSVVPVVDLRMKFGLSETEQTISTSIIVAEIEMSNETVVVGSLADSVQEVINMDTEQIESTPRMGSKINTEFIKGIGKHGGRFILVLDFDRIFSAAELAEVVEKEEAPVQ